MSRRYRAILIGNWSFPEDESALPTLLGPPNDVAHLGAVLMDSTVGLFAPADIAVVRDEPSHVILARLEAFFATSTKDEILLVYYSGHGLTDLRGESLLLSGRNSRTDSRIATMVSSYQLNELVEASPATVIIILDCCYSGRFKGGDLSEVLSGRGRFVLTSSRSTEKARDADYETGLSRFTGHLFRGLQGEAAQSARPEITVSDIYRYVHERMVAAREGIPQRRFDGDGEVAIGRNPAGPHDAGRPEDGPSGRPRAMLTTSEREINLGTVDVDDELVPERVHVMGGSGAWTATTRALWVRIEKQPTYVDLHLHPRVGANRAAIEVRDVHSGDVCVVRVFARIAPTIPEPPGRDSPEPTGTSPPAEPVTPGRTDPAAVPVATPARAEGVAVKVPAPRRVHEWGGLTRAGPDGSEAEVRPPPIHAPAGPSTRSAMRLRWLSAAAAGLVAIMPLAMVLVAWMTDNTAIAVVIKAHPVVAFGMALAGGAACCWIVWHTMSRAGPAATTDRRGPVLIVLAVTSVSAIVPLLVDRTDTPSGPVFNLDAVPSIQIGAPDHLLPSQAYDFGGLQVLKALFTPLVELDDKKQLRVAAAASITSDDGKVWRIVLKDGYRFHNGEQVTADHYIKAWNYGAYGPNGQANQYMYERIAGSADVTSLDPDGSGPVRAPKPKRSTLTGVKKIGERELEVTLSKPYRGFRAQLAEAAFLPLPNAAWASPGVLRKDFESKIIGQGPFTLSRPWSSGGTVEVSRNDDYPGGRPGIGGVRFIVQDNYQAATADLKAGKLDILEVAAAGDVPAARRDFGDRLVQPFTTGMQFLVFPVYQKAYADPAVRRAISRAIDRDALTTTVLNGAPYPARSFVAPSVPGSRENSCGDGCAYLPADARREYAAAHGPAKITITYNADLHHKAWVEATCNQLSTNLGIECAAVPEPTLQGMISKLAEKKATGLVRSAWSVDYPALDEGLAPLFTTAVYSNYAGWTSAAFDSLVDAGNKAPDEATATAKFQAAEDIVAKEMPIVPLRFERHTMALSRSVVTIDFDQWGAIDLIGLRIA